MDSAAIIGVSGFVVMLALVMVGVPVFVSMLLPSIAGFWLIGGQSMMAAQLTQAPFAITANYAWAVVPLFIVMGELAGVSGVAELAYQATYRWLARIRGGILMATIGGNAIFGACSGVPVSGLVIFTRIAWPEIQKVGLDRKFSLACLSSGGILAILIPPSIPIVILCVLTNLSVGQALLAGVTPGILCAVVLGLIVWLTGKRSPAKLPIFTAFTSSWKEKFGSILALWPIVGVFVLIMAGIYAGFFSPTVAGGVGAVGLLIYSLYKRVRPRKLARTFWDATVINAQIFPIVIAGFIFGRFIALSGLAEALGNAISNSNLPPLLIMAAIMVFYLAAGCIGEVMAMMIITLPIFFPLAVTLGFDPYAFAIILVFMIGLGNLTPPIGLNVFVVATIAKVRPMEVYRGVMPFFLAQIALVWLFLLVPKVVTWLPDLLYK